MNTTQANTYSKKIYPTLKGLKNEKLTPKVKYLKPLPKLKNYKVKIFKRLSELPGF